MNSALGLINTSWLAIQTTTELTDYYLGANFNEDREADIWFNFRKR